MNAAVCPLEADDAEACDDIIRSLPYHPDPERGDGYGATRAFYRSVGSSLVCDLPQEWESDAVVLLVKAID